MSAKSLIDRSLMLTSHSTVSADPCSILSRVHHPGWETNTETVVYNARKRGADRASDYFKRTENIAGVKDMRFQALMPDILHWLGIKKIDRMLSMSK